jgi:hypothetical protein
VSLTHGYNLYDQENPSVLLGSHLGEASTPEKAGLDRLPPRLSPQKKTIAFLSS